MRSVEISKAWLLLALLPLWGSAASLPEGFEGLPWEAPVAQLPNAQKLAETVAYQCYRKGDGSGKLGTVVLSNQRLCFSQDRFYFAQMEFAGQSGYEALLAHAQSLWGEGRAGQRFTETRVWGGGEDKVYIELEYSKLDERGTLAFVYLPIYKESQDASRQQRARARPGAGF